MVTLGLLGMPACGGSDLEDRVQRLERRVGALEGAAARVPPAPAVHGATAEVLDLERRLTALEERIASTATGPAGTATPGAAAAATARMDQRRERRARLREVTDEYRARLTAIRDSQADPAARQQAVREALEWYREQRRAILDGEPPPGQ